MTAALNNRANGGDIELGCRPIRAAIAGTGYISGFHARGIKEATGVKLVAVCDANPKAAQSFANAWGVPRVFDSLEAMLENEKLDAVHILVPPDLHSKLAKL